MKPKITQIDVIPIYPRLAERYASRRIDLYGIDARTFFRVHTDAGITGYGDQRVRPWGQPDPESVQHLVDKSPFDFLHNNQALPSGLNCALYDAMGKILDVPVHQLFGPKLRDWVPVAAWTRPASPEDFAAEIKRAAAQGYTVFKMHTCAYHDVFEQTRLATQAAPPGFRIHYDLNHNRSLGVVLPIVRELERDWPIVGYIEDPLVKNDLPGWRALRQQTGLPVIMHGTPLGGVQELLHDVADMYMIGGSMQDTLAAGLACARANLQVLLQFEGGTLGKAMAMHMAAVFRTHTAHSINLDDQYAEDVTTATIPVVNGSSPVPDGPGLGYEVDEDAVERLSKQELTERPRFVGILHMPDGGTYYGPGYISPGRVTGREEGDIRGFRSELREDDGSKEFEKLYKRVQQKGVFRA